MLTTQHLYGMIKLIIVCKGGFSLQQDRFDKFSHLTSSAVKSIQKLKIKGMLPFGLTAAHTVCLRHIYNAPDGITRTKLVRLCDIDKAQISRTINDLCSKGYVIETENENVSYRKRLKLTPMGKDTTEMINRKILTVNEFVSNDIPDDELETFYETLNKICERLKLAETELEEVLTENDSKPRKTSI